MLSPTFKQTISPGPAVAAIPSILLKFKLLLLKASFIIRSIFSACDLAASSGTIPPNFL